MSDISTEPESYPPSWPWSLYLVTSSDNLPAKSSVESVVSEAIRGGVSIIQLREKKLPTKLFLERARSLRKICQPPVKLIINDRVDIALACNADGVHLGQEDMPFEDARKILGKDAIIGISVNTLAEAIAAVEQGANYLGIGTCWPTATKLIPEHKIIGPRGVKLIRDELVRLGKKIPVVVIGGINSNNLVRTLYGCLTRQFYNRKNEEVPIGIAVVSAIMSAEDPFHATQTLKALTEWFLKWVQLSQNPLNPKKPHFRISELLMKDLMQNSTDKLLIHHITNTVVQNDCANLTLAYGRSPIMSSNVNEVEEFTQSGCLVLNLGTCDENQIQAMKLAGKKANSVGKPIIFDPVGLGASCERRRMTKDLLNHVQMSVIKGNQAEISTLLNSSHKGASSIGVDAIGEVDKPNELVLKLAQQELCVVVMTGKTDWISDGFRVYKLCNGVDELSSITGSGCMIGTSIACMLARFDCRGERGQEVVGPLLRHLSDLHSTHVILNSAILGISVFNISAEFIMKSESNQSDFGPNALKMKIMDRIFKGRKENLFWDNILSTISITCV